MILPWHRREFVVDCARHHGGVELLDGVAVGHPGAGGGLLLLGVLDYLRNEVIVVVTAEAARATVVLPTVIHVVE